MGRFASRQIRGLSKGGVRTYYGIYVINKRIIGISSPKMLMLYLMYELFAGSCVGLVGFGLVAAGEYVLAIIVVFVLIAMLSLLIGGRIVQNVSNALENYKSVKELDEKKGFEVDKDEILQIDFSNPSRRGGLLTVIRKSENPVKISIPTREEFQKAVNLMRDFYPEAIRMSGE